MPCVEGDAGLHSLIVGQLSVAISHDLLFNTPLPGYSLCGDILKIMHLQQSKEVQSSFISEGYTKGGLFCQDGCIKV